MTRVQKRFLNKIKKPVLIYTGLLGSAVFIHYISTLFGYTIVHVIAYTGIVLVYLAVPLAIVGVLLWYVVDKAREKWQEARNEVAGENQELIMAIDNDKYAHKQGNVYENAL